MTEQARKPPGKGPKQKPQKVEDLLEGLKAIAPKETDELFRKILDERYPKNQEFTEFETVQGEGEKSYLAFMAGPNKDIPVVFKEGQTSPDFLLWAVDEITHGRPVRLNVDWDFKFNEDRTQVTEARVTKLFVTETWNLEPDAPEDQLEVKHEDWNRILYDENGKLDDEKVREFLKDNPNYVYSDLGTGVYDEL